jgi:hypothetical protein
MEEHELLVLRKERRQLGVKHDSKVKSQARSRREKRYCANHPGKLVKVLPILDYGSYFDFYSRGDYEPYAWKLCRECWFILPQHLKDLKPCYYCGNDGKWESTLQCYCCYDCL